MSIFQTVGRALKLIDVQDTREIGAPSGETDTTDWVMSMYPSWRSLYDGSCLDETIATKRRSAQKQLKYPAKADLVGTYCRLHAGLVFGRGQTGKDRERLLTIRIDPEVPGQKPPTAVKAALEKTLNYFWNKQSSVLRENAVIQQWAGGCIIKIAWNPYSPNAVMGITLDTIQPEHFWPQWSPTNVRELVGAYVAFRVPPAVARHTYGLSDAEIQKLTQDKPDILIEERWTTLTYEVVLGSDVTSEQGGIVGKWRDGQPMKGSNPWLNPYTKRGMIPFVYVPRFRSGGFYGESLAQKLEGLQVEYNKALADYGDALNRSSHPSAGISNYRGPARSDSGSGVRTIPMPRGALLDLGESGPLNDPAKVHPFPKAEVPAQTEAYTDRLIGTADFQAGLTPAAKGIVEGQASGIAMAAAMLPTINLIDGTRDFWNDGICLGTGVNAIMLAIWLSKPALAGKRTNGIYVPKIPDVAFLLDQRAEFRPVLPRDRAQIIDEVVKLATSRAVSPWEWLERLGDIEDMDLELQRLVAFLIMMAQIEAAVAGREIEVSTPKVAGGESAPVAPESLPQVAAKPEPATTMPAKQTQAQTKSKGSDGK